MLRAITKAKITKTNALVAWNTVEDSIGLYETREVSIVKVVA